MISRFTLGFFKILYYNIRHCKLVLYCMQYIVWTGSGSLFTSNDGGKSWKRDKGTDNIPGNFYTVKFFNGQNGFVLGNSGILLKYVAWFKYF